MPTLNRPKKPKKCVKHGQQAEISKLYKSVQWQRLRAAYYMEHPLCERCLLHGITSATAEIHHVKPISKGTTLLEMQDIAFNINNLMALCTKCHHDIHKEIEYGKERKS